MRRSRPHRPAQAPQFTSSDAVLDAVLDGTLEEREAARALYVTRAVLTTALKDRRVRRADPTPALPVNGEGAGAGNASLPVDGEGRGGGWDGGAA